MRIILVMALTLATISEMRAQSGAQELDALLVAWRHVRSDIPTGAVALQIEGLPTPSQAPALAASLEAQARHRADIVGCERLPVRLTSCRLRGFAGVLGANSVQRIAPDRVDAVVWTQVQESNEIRSWIYRRTYLVELGLNEREGWTVIASKLISES